MTEAEYIAAQAAQQAATVAAPQSTMQTVVDTAVKTAEAILPTLASADPRAATIMALAPLALQLLQIGTQANQAGLLPDSQLAALFASVGSGIQSTHNAWAAMNAADAAKTA